MKYNIIPVQTIIPQIQKQFFQHIKKDNPSKGKVIPIQIFTILLFFQHFTNFCNG